MIVCSTSVRSAGCTFLDWSVHFLTGQTDFYHTMRGWGPLSPNPIDRINAHGHKKNHPSGLAKTQQALLQCQQQHNRLTSIYPHPIQNDDAAKDLSIDINTMTSEQWKLVLDYQQVDYNQMLQMCHAHSVKIIVVSISDHLCMYANTVRSLDRMPFYNRSAESADSIHDSIDNIFFKDAIREWQNLGLHDIWDVRERRALKNNLLEWKQQPVDLNFDHYWVDAQNLWYNGEREIPKIIQWLGLTMESDRFNLWVPICQEWQKMQLDTLQFQYNYQHIVDSVVNNWSYSIDLTFEQEVIIQHCLIYQHNLNLKTWQLTKFPNNTQEIHKLLEPNIHPL